MTELVPPRADTGDMGTPDTTLEERKSYEASQWRLVWWRFRQHRLAVASAVVVLLLYLITLFAEFLAPFSTTRFDPDYIEAPPQRVHIDTSGLYVYDYARTMDEETLKLVYEPDESARIDLGFFVRGEEYKLLGVIPWDRHLFGPTDPDQHVYLLGADAQGRDLFSRILYGTRLSMTIGLVGVAMSFIVGILLGGISGYFGGRTDTVMQRILEFFMGIPGLPLWLGLAAAMPLTWGVVQRYFAITVILGILGWTGIARDVRGKFLSLREDEFVTSAHIDGNSRSRVMFRHMLPSFASHLIAITTLHIPGMILGETALSFIGLGLVPPAVSWGVLLSKAQQVSVVANAPWLMLPGLAVVVAVLAWNFVGDGLRDAADPYKN